MDPKEVVSEHVYIAASAPAHARLLEYLADIHTFLSAYHSEYWGDYAAAWQRASRALTTCGQAADERAAIQHD